MNSREAWKGPRPPRPFLSGVSDPQDAPDAPEYPDCPVCGDPIDYCQGHGSMDEPNEYEADPAYDPEAIF